MKDIKILYEDKAVLACVKPPGMPVASDKSNDVDLVSYFKTILKERDNIAMPYVGLVHRLDRPVGGVVLLAKTEQSNRNINDQISKRRVAKKYLAVVCGELSQSGELEDYILKDSKTNMSRIVEKDINGGKKANLSYRTISQKDTEDGVLSLVEIQLETGRHHQIRVQMAHHGYPLWGDTKYNPVFNNQSGWHHIALWSYAFGLLHPNTNKPIAFTSYPRDVYPFNLFKEMY